MFSGCIYSLFLIEIEDKLKKKKLKGKEKEGRKEAILCFQPETQYSVSILGAIL